MKWSGWAKSIHTKEYQLFLKLLIKSRSDAGLTQTELAEKLGVTQTFISKCERGERRIDLIELRNICRAMKTDLSDFVSLLEDELRD